MSGNSLAPARASCPGLMPGPLAQALCPGLVRAGDETGIRPIPPLLGDGIKEFLVFRHPPVTEQRVSHCMSGDGPLNFSSISVPPLSGDGPGNFTCSTIVWRRTGDFHLFCHCPMSGQGFSLFRYCQLAGQVLLPVLS